MGREGDGVELRDKSIRVNFTLKGVRQRVTLKMEPTPVNERYAIKLMAKVRRAVDAGTFDWET
ncbi:MAG: Arm DNA-binding domain-containing protein [Acidovorax sp.]